MVNPRNNFQIGNWRVQHNPPTKLPAASVAVLAAAAARREERRNRGTGEGFASATNCYQIYIVK